MYYSYYYNIDKTHRVNFGFKALTTNEETDGTINAQFNVYISEVLNGEVKHEENKNVQFKFDGSKRKDDDVSDYDVDLLRERVAKSQKLIFKVVNNRNSAQNATVGLITPTAEKNPLGCEIIYENEPYKAELKAGNLSRLEAQYTEPAIRQTVISYAFNEGGVPDELYLPDGGEYMSAYRLYRTTRLATSFKKPISGKNKFGFETNIAPETFEAASGPAIFEVVLSGIGTFVLNGSSIGFQKDGGTAEDRVLSPLVQKLTADYFFNGGLRTNSLLRIEGDGKGNIKATYAGVEVKTTYNSQNDFTGVSFEGKLRKGIAERIMLKLDNIVAYYEK